MHSQLNIFQDKNKISKATDVNDFSLLIDYHDSKRIITSLNKHKKTDTKQIFFQSKKIEVNTRF